MTFKETKFTILSSNFLLIIMGAISILIQDKYIYLASLIFLIAIVIFTIIKDFLLIIWGLIDE